MLEGSSTETSEAHYTIGMQNDAQMTKPTPNNPYAGPKQWQNEMRQWLEMHLNEAHAMAHKWGIMMQLINTIKG